MTRQFHNIRILAAVALALVALCAEAWEKKTGSSWYEPLTYQPGQYETTFTVTDEYGYKAPVAVRFDENGVLDEDSKGLLYYSINLPENKIKTMAEIANLVQFVTQLADAAHKTDARFETLAKNLDETITEILKKLSEIETRDDSGNKTVQKVEKIENNKIYYRLVGGGVATDGKSVEFAKVASSSSTNVTNRLQLRGFDKAKKFQIPFVDNGGLSWTGVGFFADERMFDTGEEPDYSRMISLKNWAAPDKTCSPTLGKMVSGVKPADAATHYVLTRCEENGATTLHYTKIGGVAGGADNAGKYLRTSSDGESSEWAFPVTEVKSGGGIDVRTDEKTGAVTLTLDGEAISVQSEATTDGTTALMSGRRVVFRAMDDSCVKVDVAQGASTNEIVVTIGCYYK